MEQEMNGKQPLLSICIPTWNRAKYLEISLKRIRSQISSIEDGLLEIFVSDNCSSDATEDVVKRLIIDGMPINYNRNLENLGMDRNFLQCIQHAAGKYIMLVGDDDVFKDGAIAYLLHVLSQGDFGMLNVAAVKGREEMEVYNNPTDFLKRVSYWTTFISANIFRSDIVNAISNPEHYFQSYFLHIPYYIKAVNAHTQNVVVNKEVFDSGLDSKSNGGYNLYKVFVESFLGLLREHVDSSELSVSTFEYIKKDLYVNFLIFYNYRLLCRRKGVRKIDKSGKGRGGFAIDNAWSILFHYYGGYWYFYYSLLLLPYLGLKDAVKYGLKCIGLRK